MLSLIIAAVPDSSSPPTALQPSGAALGLADLLQQPKLAAGALAQAVLQNPEQLLSLSAGQRLILYQKLAEPGSGQGAGADKGAYNRVGLARTILDYVNSHPSSSPQALANKITELQAEIQGESNPNDDHVLNVGGRHYNRRDIPDIPPDQYFEPTTLPRVSEEFRQRNKIVNVADYMQTHDGFAHMLFPPIERSNGVHLSDVTDEALEFLEQYPIEQAKKELFNLRRSMSFDTRAWVIRQIEHNAALNNMDIREFARAIRDPARRDTLKLQRPRDMPFEAGLHLGRQLRPEQIFPGMSLTFGHFPGAQLAGADLGGIDLSYARLTRANLAGANLVGANLYRTNLTKANLTGANLAEADLRGVDLYLANLTRANLQGVELDDFSHFEGADLTDACGVTPELREKLIALGARNVPDRELIYHPPAQKYSAGGAVISPDEVTGSAEDRARLAKLFNPNTQANDPGPVRDLILQGQSTGRPRDRNAAELEAALKARGFDTQAAPRLPTTTAHNPEASRHTPPTVFKSPPGSDKDRITGDPQPSHQSGIDSPLTQAISNLRNSDNVATLLQTGSHTGTPSPMLRVLLSQTGLKQVLQYGLGMKLLAGLSQNGGSRYLRGYNTPELLQTISQRHPELAPAALAMRTQALNVLAARAEALAPAATRRSTPGVSTQMQRLQRSIDTLQSAKTQAMRVAALRQLQAQVSSLNQTLTAARAGNAFQNQIEFNLMKAGLEKMQVWLADPQRIEDARQMSQVLWQGAVAVVAGIAGSAWGSLQEALQLQRL